MIRVKKWFGWFLPVLALVAIGVGGFDRAQAAIVLSGDVSPAASDTWATGYYTGSVGNSADGSVTIDDGSTANITTAYLGDNEGASGTVTVDGAGSSLTNSSLYVGRYGNGTLQIRNGGNVTASMKTYLAWAGTNTGIIEMDGGTLTTNTLAYSSSSQITGTGTINVRGLASDESLVFDATHGASQSFTLSGSSVTVNLDTDNPAVPGGLYVGYQSNTASLMIQDGVEVYSSAGCVGYITGPSNITGVGGTATVTGDGSAWRVRGLTMAGAGSTAELKIADGGTLAVYGIGSIGYGSSFGVGTATATVSGSGSTWSNSSYLYVGQQYSKAELLIEDGATVSNTKGYIAYSNAYGTVTVDGSGSTWTNSDEVNIGYDGYGVLKITNGGAASSADVCNIGRNSSSAGTMTVDGPGSTWTTSDNYLYVGQLGKGILEITNGGVVHSEMGVIAKASTAFNCIATVDGAGSQWIISDGLAVGPMGNGTLKIANGAVVSVAGKTEVGGAFFGDGTLEFATGTDGAGVLETKTFKATSSDVTGVGTINTHGLVSDVDLMFDSTHGASHSFTINGSVTVNLDLSDSTNVGDLGAGNGSSSSLTIKDGVTVYSDIGWLTCAFTATSTATVEGTGSTWNTAELYVGYLGAATLDVTNGGLVAADNIRLCAAGTLNIANGGTVAANGISLYSGSPVMTFDDGTLQAGTSSTSFVTTSSSANIYVKQGGATIDTNSYDVTIAQPLLTDGVGAGGLTKTGDGTLTLSGANDYDGLTTVVAGVLELDGSAQNPVLNLGGADIQGGKLVFDYSMTAPDVSTLLNASFTGGTAAWTTGQFISTTADGNHGLGWIDNGTDKVTVMYTLYGDSNLDGSVNGSDLNAVLSSYNLSGQVWADGDFNYDGSVNGSDLNTVLSNYNQSLSASTAAVPEPSTLLLLVLGLVGLLAYVKRKRM